MKLTSTPSSRAHTQTKPSRLFDSNAPGIKDSEHLCPSGFAHAARAQIVYRDDLSNQLFLISSEFLILRALYAKKKTQRVFLFWRARKERFGASMPLRLRPRCACPNRLSWRFVEPAVFDFVGVSHPSCALRKKKDPKGLFILARPEGFEPPTT